MRELQFLEDVDAPPQPIRLAVLPFENVRKDASLDYLGFALADAIIAKLSYLRSVSVLPSSYVRKYRERQPDPKEIRADLGVDHALTGGFVASGERLRVSLQLVNLEAGTLRWESSLDVSRKELLGLQDEIVERVVSGMEVTLTEDEEDRIQRDAPSDPDAYDIALRTLDIPATVEGTRRAIRQLEESLERDPRFAPAWGILATRQYDATLYGREDPSLHEAAERSARRALEINPEQPIALQMLGVILTERGRHEEAYLTIKKWTRVNPSLAEAHFNLSYVFRYTGLFEEAAEAARRAVALAPNNPRFRSLGFLYQYMGDHDLAETFLNLDRGSPWSLSNLSTLAFVRGDRASARALAEEALAADPNGHFAVAARALMETLDGDLAGAARTLRRMAAVPSPDPEMTFWVGAGFAAVGARDEAIETLWRAVRGGFYAAPLYETDPRLETLRRDPRFAAILEEVRRRRDAFRAFVEANP
jgi:TolB-like protein/Flp pilus assembly protein TadD